MLVNGLVYGHVRKWGLQQPLLINSAAWKCITITAAFSCNDGCTFTFFSAKGLSSITSGLL